MCFGAFIFYYCPAAYGATKTLALFLCFPTKIRRPILAVERVGVFSVFQTGISDTHPTLPSTCSKLLQDARVGTLEGPGPRWDLVGIWENKELNKHAQR